jgi:type IV pilus assembly protein PilB
MPAVNSGENMATAPRVVTAYGNNASNISSQAGLRAALRHPHNAERVPLGDLLRREALVTQTGVFKALALQHSGHRGRIGEILLEGGRVAERDVYATLAHQLGLPYVRLAEFDVDPQALMMLPQHVARSLSALPLMLDRGRLIVAVCEPGDTGALNALRFAASCPIETVLAAPEDIRAAIATHYPPFEDAALTEHSTGAPANQTTPAELTLTGAEAPIVRLVTNLLHDAVDRHASDVHVRPGANSAEVLFRIDGSLVSVRTFAKALLPAVMARIKVLCGMNLAEHRLPQDGAMHMSVRGRAVDMRVSVMPTIHGESAVVRLLDPSISLRKLNGVGFSAHDESRFRALLNRNQGLVLVTGPTGSGKTTTLYAGLQELNTGEFQIITVENPVEYRLDGVLQIQVQPTIGYSFETALRHILRHDPDVILIGEIRDRDTARIAVESALTGHLVLSTLHTNSAVQAITRLVEIGVEPYLVNATLAGVLAQRLVRRNCPACRKLEIVESATRAALGIEESEAFWRGGGCDECSGTGYRGRVAVYELLEITPVLRERIHARAGDDELQALAEKEGMVRLTTQALALARSGETSLAEVYRARLE